MAILQNGQLEAQKITLGNAEIERLGAMFNREQVTTRQPQNFLVSRAFMQQHVSAIARMCLFPDGTELDKLKVSLSKPKPRGITDKDVTEAVVDLCRQLDLQTVRYNKEHKRTEPTGVAVAEYGQDGKFINNGGYILLSAREWAKTFFAKDKPSGSERDKAMRILQYLNSATAVITDESGSELECAFITIWMSKKNARTKQPIYLVQLNPIFSNFSGGYGKLPQDYKHKLREAKKQVTAELREAGVKVTGANGQCTKADLDILLYLATQSKQQRHSVRMETVLHYCGLTEEYDKKKLATQIKVLVAMKAAALVLGWKVTMKPHKVRGKEYIHTFEFVHKDKQDEPPQDEVLRLGNEQEKEKAK